MTFTLDQSNLVCITGETRTLTATGKLSATKANISVIFTPGGSAQISASTADSVTFTVPSLDFDGTITVTVTDGTNVTGTSIPIPFKVFGASKDVYVVPGLTNVEIEGYGFQPNSTYKFNTNSASEISYTPLFSSASKMFISIPRTVTSNTHLIIFNNGTSNFVANRVSGIKLYGVNVSTDLTPVVDPDFIAAGNTMTIRGYGFTPSTLVKVGGLSAPVLTQDSNRLTVTAPGPLIGTTDVQVYENGGSSTFTSASNAIFYFGSASKNLVTLPGESLRIPGSFGVNQSLMSVNLIWNSGYNKLAVTDFAISSEIYGPGRSIVIPSIPSNDLIHASNVVDVVMRYNVSASQSYVSTVPFRYYGITNMYPNQISSSFNGDITISAINVNNLDTTTLRLGVDRNNNGGYTVLSNERKITIDGSRFSTILVNSLAINKSRVYLSTQTGVYIANEVTAGVNGLTLIDTYGSFEFTKSTIDSASDNVSVSLSSSNPNNTSSTIYSTTNDTITVTLAGFSTIKKVLLGTTDITSSITATSSGFTFKMVSLDQFSSGKVEVTDVNNIVRSSSQTIENKSVYELSVTINSVDITGSFSETAASRTGITANITSSPPLKFSNGNVVATTLSLTNISKDTKFTGTISQPAQVATYVITCEFRDTANNLLSTIIRSVNYVPPDFDAATDAANEATDAANAATDAAVAAADAADAATDAIAKAQNTADSVAALSNQVSVFIDALKKQITALTNLVIKIQKKVSAK